MAFCWSFLEKLFIYFCLLLFAAILFVPLMFSPRVKTQIDERTQIWTYWCQNIHTHTNKRPHVHTHSHTQSYTYTLHSHTHTHTHHICIDFSIYYETASPLHDAKILIVFLLLFFCICSCCYKQLIVKDGSLKIIHSSLNIWNDI
jgi:hypothetical protein